MFRHPFLAALLLGVLVVSGSPGGSAPLVGRSAPPELYRARLEAARRAYKVTLKALRTGRADADTMYLWSVRWLESEKAVSKTKAERIAACTAHLKRMEDLGKLVEVRFKTGNADFSQTVAIQFYLAEARVWEAEAKVK
jgi:hypothetical protein